MLPPSLPSPWYLALPFEVETNFLGGQWVFDQPGGAELQENRGLTKTSFLPHDVLAVGREPSSPASCRAGLLLTPDELQVLAGEHAARERPLGQMFQGFVAQVGEAGVG